MAILPVLFFVLLSLLLQLWDPSDFRESILKSYLISGFIVLASTEVLSKFNLISFGGVLSIWSGLNLIVLGILIKTARKNQVFSQKFKTNAKQVSLPKLTPTAIICLFILILICGTTLYIALKAPPNNYDSMTYHMARVSNWIQNQNINYYPTATPRQNYSMPLAEFWILHLQLLSKSDQFANLVQWFGFLAAILCCTLLAKQLKISPRGQWITAATAATIPMALLQSTSTQNDIIVGIFCLSFSYFLFESIHKKTWQEPLFAGLSLGLALATKGTGYLYCAGIGIGYGGMSLFHKNWREIKSLFQRFIIIIALGLILNSGIYSRNLQLYNNPLMTSNERVVVEKFTPQILFANVVRNSMMNLASPITRANQFFEKIAQNILGDQISNPASTYKWTTFHLSFKTSEDDANNFIHQIFLVAALISLPWLKLENKKILYRYALTIILSFLLICSVLKWQPWGVRLQTLLFLMGSILIAAVLDQLLGNRNLFLLYLLTAMGLASIPYLLFNSARPLLPVWEDGSVFYKGSGERRFLQGLESYPIADSLLDSFLSIFYEGRSVETLDRYQLLFFSKPEDYYWYKDACEFILNDPAQEIGLLMENNQWEYPIWVCLGQHASPGPRRLIPIGIDNAIKSTQPGTTPLPELIFVTRKNIKDPNLLSQYEEVLSRGYVRIYKLVY